MKVTIASIINCWRLSAYPRFPINESDPSTTISIATPIKTGGAKSNNLLSIE